MQCGCGSWLVFALAPSMGCLCPSPRGCSGGGEEGAGRGRRRGRAALFLSVRTEHCLHAPPPHPCCAGILGKYLEQLTGTYYDEDYPRECLPGTLGSSDPEFQLGSQCAGLWCASSAQTARPAPSSPGARPRTCTETPLPLYARSPAGSYCPNYATTQVKSCPPGHYCAEGTAEPVPCPDGTYGPNDGNAAAEDCILCPAGHSCPAGSANANNCTRGTYQPLMGERACLECTAGTYTDAVASVECHICGAGSYSSNVLSCLPCPVGECRRRVARVSPPDGPHAAS